VRGAEAGARGQLRDPEEGEHPLLEVWNSLNIYVNEEFTVDSVCDRGL
jgi:hypothetical protein